MAPRFPERLVLLVGGEPTTTSLLANALTASRSRLEQADDVAAARERLSDVRARTPDLVLLDMADHRTRQLSLLRWLRERAETANLPVVALTGPQGGRDIRAALAAGADAYLTRPIQPQVLLACVQGVLRHQPAVLATRPLSFAESQEIVDLFGRDPRRVPSLPNSTADFHSSEWAIFKAIEAAMGRSLRSGSPLAILMIRAKSQEPLGDTDSGQFLLQAGEEIRRVLPTSAALKLFDQNVFCGVLPETTEPVVLAKVRRIIEQLDTQPLAVGKRAVAATARCGIAVGQPPFSSSPFRLIDQARQALIEASKRDTCGFWVVHPEVVR